MKGTGETVAKQTALELHRLIAYLITSEDPRKHLIPLLPPSLHSHQRLHLTAKATGSSKCQGSGGNVHEGPAQDILAMVAGSQVEGWEPPGYSQPG